MIKKLKWFKYEDIQKIHYLMLTWPMYSCCNDFSKFGVRNFKHSVTEVINGNSNIIIVRDEFKKTSREWLEKIKKDADWALEITKMVIEKAMEMKKIAEKVRKINLKEKSDKELYKYYFDFTQAQRWSHCGGWIGGLDYEDYLFSKYLEDYLRGKIKKKYNFSKVFITLTTPFEESAIQEEERELLKLALKSSGLEEHWKKYEWIPYMFTGPCWDKKYFKNRLNELKKLSKKEINKRLKELNEKKKEIKKDSERFIKKLKIDKKHKKMLELARSFVESKSIRKDAMSYGYYCIEKLLREIGSRLNLSLEQVQFILPLEMEEVFLKRKVPDDLSQRKKYSVFYVDGKKWKIFSGKKAKEFMKNIKIGEEKEEKLKGMCAYPGTIKGNVKIINTPSEMKKMNKGDILIARQTNPDLLPAMEKSAAIVTDIGGITCHAAIVARELKIPCVVGVKNATVVLKDGDFVDVDADHGMVRKVE